MSGHWRRYEVIPEPSKEGPSAWRLIFHAQTDGREIVVVIPASGVFDKSDSTEKLEANQVQRLAHAMSALFDAVLANPE